MGAFLGKTTLKDLRAENDRLREEKATLLKRNQWLERNIKGVEATQALVAESSIVALNAVKTESL